jgi:hypothetical protein
MSETLLEGYKAIANALGMCEATARSEAATYPDPLPVRQWGDGGGVWGKPERLRLHRLRHAKGAVHPIAGLPVLVEWAPIAKMARLTIDRAKHLAPWSEPAVEDPIPVFHLTDGRVAAYRDAMVDWLDRRSRTASGPRYRRKWDVRCAKAERRERKMLSAKRRAHA